MIELLVFGFEQQASNLINHLVSIKEVLEFNWQQWGPQNSNHGLKHPDPIQEERIILINNEYQLLK